MAATEAEASDGAGRPRVSEGARRKPFHPLDFLLHRGLLIAVFGAIAGLAGALVFSQKGSYEYRTRATLLVDGGTKETLLGRESDIIPGNIGDYMRTLTVRIRSLKNLKAALKRLPENQWPPFLDPSASPTRNAIELLKRIEAREKRRTYLISVGIRAESKEDLGVTLNTVIETFLEALAEQQQQRFAQRLEYLRAEKRKVFQRIVEEQEKVVAMADEVGNKAFLHEGYDLHYSALQEVQELSLKARDGLLAARSELEKAIKDREDLEQLSIDPLAQDRLIDNLGINRTELWTYQQLQEMRASIDGLTPSNPERQYVDQRMEAMEEYLREFKRDVSKETSRTIRETLQYELDAEVIRAENLVDAREEQVSRYAETLRQTRERAAAVSTAIFDAFGPLQTIDQYRVRLRALQTRIDDTEVEAKGPMPVTFYERAVNPTVPSSNSSDKWRMLGAVIGFGMVFGIFLVFDFVDNRIRRPADLDKALGTRAGKPVARTETGGFPGIVLRQPRHPSALAVQSLAEKIHRDHERFGGRVYGVGAVSPSAGASSIALNLGLALRQSLDRVLVVEIAFQRPGLRKLLPEDGVSGGEWFPNLESTPPSPARWKEGGIDLLTAGEKNEGLLPKSLVTQTIDTLADRYDAVVVDLGCFNEDPVAAHQAVHCDAITLVTREDASLFYHLREAIDFLVDARIPAMTAVLNFCTATPPDAPVQWLQRRLSVLTRLHQRLPRPLKRRS